MNIVLRILVILTLILNGVALWFSLALYGKRNLLIDRNDSFRDFTIKIARTFEAAEDREEQAAAAPAPDKSDFWETYKQAYEKIDNKSYAIPNTSDLDEVYVLDGEGKPVLDSHGDPEKEGAPMANALEEVLKMANAQRARMNNIRDQLAKLRAEYEETVADLNAVKKQGRESLKTIAERDETIAGLEADKARLEGEITELKSQISTLENEKQSLQADLDKANEELENLKAENEKLRKVIEENIRGGANPNGPLAAVANIAAGVKGTVVRVNNEYNYCLVKLSDEALTELIGENGDRPLPEIDYLIRRPGVDGVVGKVRLRTLTKDVKTIVCDILADWKQGDVKNGDEIFYLD